MKARLISDRCIKDAARMLLTAADGDGPEQEGTRRGIRCMRNMLLAVTKLKRKYKTP